MLQRFLDDIESLHIGMPCNAVAAEYEGSINTDVLARAFRLLCDSFPVLRAQIRREHERYLLYVAPRHYPRVTVLDGDEGVLQREVDRSADMAPDVAQLVVVQRDGGGYVSLFRSHAIADNAPREVWFKALWRIYTDLMNGFEGRVFTKELLPRSCRELLSERWREFPLFTPGTTLNKPSSAKAGYRERVRFSRDETTRLIAAARRLQTSIHALVCGASIVAFRGSVGVAGSTAMACNSAVNLRSHVTPPVRPTETTNFICGYMVELSVAEDSDPIFIGREVKRQLGAAIKARSFPSPEMDRRAQGFMEEGRLYDINNLGVAPELDHPEELRIVDYINLFSAWPVTKKPSHLTITFDGRMSLYCLYPGTYVPDEEMRRIVDGTVDQLREISLSYG